jgi:hypothetical protein
MKQWREKVTQKKWKGKEEKEKVQKCEKIKVKCFYF